jgi:acetyl-CoA acetyltransferase
MEREELAWKGVSVAAGALAAGAARRAAVVAWEKSTHAPAPTGAESAERPWSRAMLWAVTVAIGVAIARVSVERATAAAWTRATGSPPPSTNRPDAEHGSSLRGLLRG